MGTDLVVTVDASDDATARAASEHLAAEARRLEAVFTVFAPDSELCRWRRGEVDRPSPELDRLLRIAGRWQTRTGGAWHPATRGLTRHWEAAERVGRPPGRDEMAALASELGPAIEIDGDGRLRPGVGAANLDLNGLAKGHVVDRLVETAFERFDVVRIVVDAGGDLRHAGVGPARVGIEDPGRPFDNVDPAVVIELDGRAVATSGDARRWFLVAGRRWSRVLDPRTGWPAEHTSAATVVAPDAAAADVLATVCTVLDPNEAAAVIERLVRDGHDCSARIVPASGGVRVAGKVIPAMASG